MLDYNLNFGFFHQLIQRVLDLKIFTYMCIYIFPGTDCLCVSEEMRHLPTSKILLCTYGSQLSQLY